MSNNNPWWDTPKEPQTPWWDTPEEPPVVKAPPDKGQDDTIRLEPKARLLHWLEKNIHTVIYTAIGLAIAVGILKIGFWRTLLIALCLSAGYLLGSYHDGNPRLLGRLKRFNRRFLDDNPFINKRN